MSVFWTKFSLPWKKCSVSNDSTADRCGARFTPATATTATSEELLQIANDLGVVVEPLHPDAEAPYLFPCSGFHGEGIELCNTKMGDCPSQSLQGNRGSLS
jgi:hypothetical protein